MINLDSTILNICDYEYNYFLSKANVQGIGLAYKSINSRITNIKCICVMVSKKLQSHLLSCNDIIPKCYKGIITDVIETGEFRTRTLTGRIRPVIGGYSIGPAGIVTGGSYGGLVQDANGLYVLSNNHVLAIDNLVPIGNPVLQPAVNEGGVSPNDIIATLDRFVPVQPITPTVTPENIVDCAIAKVTNPALVSSFIAFLGRPRGVTSPVLGMNLEMACSISELISATIRALGATLTLTSLGKKYLYKNQILVAHGVEDGDSGSLALSDDKLAVGLLFAGSSIFLLCNPIDAVLQGLNVTLVTP